ncbi:MAG: MBL fold metallo-hydrolase [Ignavibacteriales bacterium]
MNRRSFLRGGSLAALGFLLAAPFTGKNDIPAAAKNRPEPSRWLNDRLTLAWIGHSTILINLYGTWILTDPVFFENIGLYMLGYTWGPSRYTAPALSIEAIPKPDIILLSHAHMDHMDYATLMHIAEKFPGKIDVVTSFRSKDVLSDLPWKSVSEIDWGQDHLVNGVAIRAYEVKHFGWRFPWERDRSRGFIRDGRSYNAYVLTKNNKKILFGGDTANTEKLNVLKGENIDVAIMPIGAYNPWKMNHCNPEEALIMADNIQAKYFIPIHCNTFQQGREPRDEPLKWLNESAGNYNIKLGLNEIGQSFEL